MERLDQIAVLEGKVKQLRWSLVLAWGLIVVIGICVAGLFSWAREVDWQLEHSKFTSDVRAYGVEEATRLRELRRSP